MEGTEDTRLLGFEAGGGEKIELCAIVDALNEIRRGLYGATEVTERNGDWKTLMFPLRTPKGHDMGVVGVSCRPNGENGPSLTDVAAIVGNMIEKAMAMLDGLHHSETEVSRDARS